MGRPPPIIRAMPERKRFFSIDVFPYLTSCKCECFLSSPLIAWIADLVGCMSFSIVVEDKRKNTLQVKLSNCINLQLSATYWSFWSGELSTIWSSEITLESGAWLQQVKKYLPFHQYSTREDIITYFCHNEYFVAFWSGRELKAIKIKNNWKSSPLKLKEKLSTITIQKSICIFSDVLRPSNVKWQVESNIGWYVIFNCLQPCFGSQIVLYK